MLDQTIYTQLRQAYDQLNGRLHREGEEIQLPPVQIAHYPIEDTALAACLLTLGIPARQPGPYTDCATLDILGNETGRHITWWVGDSSPPTIEGDPATAHKTEELQVCWALRQRFEAEFPTHPLKHMRAALDARTWWVQVLQAFRGGAAILPLDPRCGIAPYVTSSLHAAAILKAHGFEPLAFNRGGFFLEATRMGLHAEELLKLAASPGQDGPQMMAHALVNFTHLVGIAKSQATILKSTHGDQTMLLTADAGESAAGRKNRDRFNRLVA